MHWPVQSRVSVFLMILASIFSHALLEGSYGSVYYTREGFMRIFLLILLLLIFSQDMLEGSQGQYITLEKKMHGEYNSLEKKYHKAKKLIKEYQSR